MTELKLVPTDALFAKIEESLSSYSQNGLLDTGRFFSEVKLVLSKLGISTYDFVNEIIQLKDYKAELDCSYYMADSAWLLDHYPAFDTIIPQPNSRTILYNRETHELIKQNTSCVGGPSSGNIINQGVVIESCPGTCNNEQVLEKVTFMDYVQGSVGYSREWRNPILMTIRDKKSVKKIHYRDHQGNHKHERFGAASPLEVSIEQQGANFWIYSTLKEPTILLKYYTFPLDEETGLPLIPEEPIIQKAIEYWLMHYFFYTAWLNSDDTNIERKIADLEVKRNETMVQALNFSKIPSFRKQIEMAHRVRNRFRAYQAMQNWHF